jgi:replicative DNA helicase
VGTAKISHWIDSGVKPCWRVITRLGRSIEVTGHHPFLTVHGWTPLHDLTVGDRIGIPRRVPIFGNDDSLPLGLIPLLASWLCDRIGDTPPGRLTEWLTETGLWETHPTERAFPPTVWSWSRERLSALLQFLFRYAGFTDSHSAIGVEIVSYRLAQDIQHALVRFGVLAELKQTDSLRWQVAVSEQESLAAFQNGIG